MALKYPISVHVKPYSGNKEKLKQEYYRRIQCGKSIEEYINSNMHECEYHSFSYDEIASAVGLSTSTVHDILMPIGGGSNGITIGNQNEERVKPQKYV